MGTNIRCKFRCVSLTTREGGYIDVEFAAAYGDSAENKAFFKSTPTGNLKFSSINPAVAEAFKPGEHYYLDLTPAATAA